MNKNSPAVQIAPSILSADFLHLGEEIRRIIEAGADLVHVDVMDGRFVPNLTMGPLIIKAIKPICTIPIDVHLMIEEPERYIETYAEAGANRIAVHAEASKHLQRTLSQIRRLGLKAGVSLNPATPPHILEYIVYDLDFILVMSVNPGFAHQDFLPSALKKIEDIQIILKKTGQAHCEIAVDGGINEKTIGPCAQRGARCFIAGSFVFGQKDYKSAIQTLRNNAQ